MSDQLLDCFDRKNIPKHWELKVADLEYDRKRRELFKVPLPEDANDNFMSHIMLTEAEIEAIKLFEIPKSEVIEPDFLMIPGGFAFDEIKTDENGNVRISGVAMKWLVNLVNELNKDNDNNTTTNEEMV